MPATLTQLRGWRPEALTVASADLARVNRAFDDAVVAVGKHVDSALSGWRGAAATAAAARALSSTVTGNHITTAVFAEVDALADAGAVIGDATRSALRIAADAVERGFTVSDGGGVRAPRFYIGNPLLDALFQSQLDEQAAGTEAELTAALVAASDLDRESAARVTAAAAELADLLFEPFGDPVSHDVRAILDGRAYLPDDPVELAKLWSRLGAVEKDALFAYDPTIGNRDGLPAHERDRFNRRRLDMLDARAHDDLNFLARRHPESARGAADWAWRALDEQVAGYRAVREQLEVRDVPRFLLHIDDRGRAVLALNNPDTADNVATFVPGTGTTLARLAGDVDRSRAMVDSAVAADRTVTTSVVAWHGYDAPRSVIPDAASDRFANAGAVALDRFQDGLRAVRAGEPSRNVVIGHSYGSTVIGAAASDENSLAADALVLVGSPGVDVERATELRLDGVDATQMRSHVFATAAPTDPIPLIADVVRNHGHGPNPARSAFGATVFDSPPGSHSAYWDRGNPALQRMGEIIVGLGDR